MGCDASKEAGGPAVVAPKAPATNSTPPGHVALGADAAATAASSAPPAPPQRARAEDYEEFVAFTGVDHVTVVRFVDDAFSRGLSLRDSVQAYFDTPPPAPNIQIAFRTNGGKTFATDDLAGAVTEATTVEALRGLVAKHYDTEPMRIRLVSRGNILRDDAQTLHDAGVRPKDKFMVVIMKGATRFRSKSGSDLG